jgi:hypothetical protein
MRDFLNRRAWRIQGKGLALVFFARRISIPPVPKPNYSFEKRSRDIAKKAKKEAKRLRKLEAKSSPEAEPGADADASQTPPAAPAE